MIGADAKIAEMFIFGDVAPASPKWWAPWVYTAFFGGLAGVATCASTYMAPLEPYRWFIWTLIGLLWLLVAAGLTKAILVTRRWLDSR